MTAAQLYFLQEVHNFILRIKFFFLEKPNKKIPDEQFSFRDNVDMLCQSDRCKFEINQARFSSHIYMKH